MAVNIPQLGLLSLPGFWRATGHVKREHCSTLILCTVLPDIRAALHCFKVPELLMEVE
jgi:hypothetical protein